jgi:hypothetical protein
MTGTKFAHASHGAIPFVFQGLFVLGKCTVISISTDYVDAIIAATGITPVAKAPRIN